MTIDLRPGSRPAASDYGNAVLLTPSDVADQPCIYPAYKIGATGGALKIVPADAPINAAPVTINVAANEVLKLAVRRIYVTGTVATTIHGLY